MADKKGRDQMPELPEWLKRYDISVGPYDQPLPSPSRRDDERVEDRQQSSDDDNE